MAAAHVFILMVGSSALGQGEAGSRDAVRRVHGRNEAFSIPSEEAEQRRFPVVLAEAFAELVFGEDAAPVLAYGGHAGERGRLWREADKDLDEEVVVAKHIGHRVGWRPGTQQPISIHTRRAGNGIDTNTKKENAINWLVCPMIQHTYVHPSCKHRYHTQSK